MKLTRKESACYFIGVIDMLTFSRNNRTPLIQMLDEKMLEETVRALMPEYKKEDIVELYRACFSEKHEGVGGTVMERCMRKNNEIIRDMGKRANENRDILGDSYE